MSVLFCSLAVLDPRVGHTWAICGHGRPSQLLLSSSDRVSAINEFICDSPVDKGQGGVTMATNFGSKLLERHFCDR